MLKLHPFVYIRTIDSMVQVWDFILVPKEPRALLFIVCVCSVKSTYIAWVTIQFSRLLSTLLWYMYIKSTVLTATEYPTYLIIVEIFVNDRLHTMSWHSLSSYQPASLTDNGRFRWSGAHCYLTTLVKVFTLLLVNLACSPVGSVIFR